MPRGLQFRNVDLHVHTPASRCFIEPDVKAQDIVAQATSVGMEAIAITDHNSAEWVDRVKEAAVGSGLTIFPGTEITVQPGVHVIAIFPEDRNGANVTDLLAELGLLADERGDSSALVTRFGIQEVIAIIRRHNALPVLAHIDDIKGAWQELRDRGQTLIQLWNAAEFAAVEIVGEELPDRIGRPPYNYRPAYYWASDNPHPDQPTKHSHRGIGTRYSCFKLDDPITWEGIRQCFEDPEVRIHRGQPAIGQLVDHSTIERIEIGGGFLAGTALELNPSLNCVIGGRGTGKSALLEIIRYALDIPSKTETNARQAQSLLGYVLPTGSRVAVLFKLRGGAGYRVERISGRPPQVFRADNEAPLDVAPAELLPMQVYGQKEVYEISQDPKFQLRLLDNYVADALKPLQHEEDSILQKLRDNATDILRLEEAVASSQEWLGRLGAIEEELYRMEKQNFVARLEQKQLYDRERHLLDRVQAQVDGLLADLDTFLQKHRLKTDSLSEEALGGLPDQDMLRAHNGLLQAIDAELAHGIALLKQRVETRWAEGQATREAWHTAIENEDRAYQALLREFEGVGQTVSPDRYIQLQQRKLELKARAREVEQQEAQIAELDEVRQRLLYELRAVRRSQFEARCKKAAELTESLTNNVRITIYPEGNRDAFKDYLRDLFAGLNVRNPQRDNLAEARAVKPEREAQRPVEIKGRTQYLVPEIPRYLDPIDLANAIRIEQQRTDEEGSLLETCFGVESDAMRRNIAGLNRRQLFELETFCVPDLPIIELQIARGDLGYRALSGLSVGQKCTALLSLVLLESPAPLLIDQPEDDLDNQFIFDKIVATLRREKERRQFLIATHNANIPVSGDAELIIVMQADEKHGRIADDGVGSIDAEPIKQSVEQILEGGEDAFRLRKEKYGIK